LQYSSNLYLWNPSTGLNRKIPLSPDHCYFDFYCFGYDHSTDDYLVFSMYCDQIPNSDDVHSHLWLFSLRANAWKEILCTTHLPFYSDASSFVYEVESVYNGLFTGWLFVMIYAGPALGIGRECDGLGPMPVGGPKFFFTRGDVYSKIWILGGVCSKIHQQTSPKN